MDLTDCWSAEKFLAGGEDRRRWASMVGEEKAEMENADAGVLSSFLFSVSSFQIEETV